MATLSAFLADIPFDYASSRNGELRSGLGAWGLGWTLIRVNLGHDLIADILLEVPPTSDEREREEMLQLDYAIAFALSEEEDYFEDSLARISTMIPVVSTSPLSPMPSPTVHEPVAYPLFAAAEEDHAPYAHVSSSSESAEDVTISGQDINDSSHEHDDQLLLDRAIAIALAEEEDPSFSNYSHPFLSEEEHTAWLVALNTPANHDPTASSSKLESENIYLNPIESQEYIAASSNSSGSSQSSESSDVSSDSEEEEDLDEPGDIATFEALSLARRPGKERAEQFDDNDDSMPLKDG